MPKTQNDFDDPVPRAYGFMEAVIQPNARSFSALAVACPACSAPAREFCTTGRMSTGKNPVPLLCPERIEVARSQGEAVVPAQPVESQPFNPGSKGNAKKLDAQDRADIVRKFRAGVKFAELARQYNVAPTSIKYVLRRAGVLTS
jgi:hypothetical protein